MDILLQKYYDSGVLLPSIRHVDLLVFVCMLIYRHCVIAREITKIHEEVVFKFFIL